MPSPREPMEPGADAQPASTALSIDAEAALAPGLYVVSTPIGRLRDITLRALDVLASADVVLAEDTRVTRRLCDAYGLKPALERYDDHADARDRARILARIAEGASVALVSDAGTPLVSDPGFKLVRAAIEEGLSVIAVPGASAALAALAVAGLPTDRFVFAGFPPAKSGGRRALFEEWTAAPATLVFYETGPRLAASLADMAAVFGDRPAVVARELTKLYEETVPGALPALAARYAADGPPKGEIVVLVAPPKAPAAWDAARVDAALAERLDEGPLKPLAAEIAAAAGWSKRDVYARAVALKDAAKAGE